MAKVLIIGAGVAGLSAGIKLKEKAHDVTIYEAAPILGGRTYSTMVGGNAFDWGAEAIEATTDAAAWLFADVDPDIGEQPVDADFNAGTFILPFDVTEAVNPLSDDEIEPTAHTTTVKSNVDAVSNDFNGTENDDYFGNVDMRLGQVEPDDVTFRQQQFAQTASGGRRRRVYLKQCQALSTGALNNEPRRA